MVDKAAIENEVRHLLKKFGKELEGVSGTHSEESEAKPRTSDGFREEGEPVCDASFSERMFSNAKKRSGRHIIAEKGAW